MQSRFWRQPGVESNLIPYSVKDQPELFSIFWGPKRELVLEKWRELMQGKHFWGDRHFKSEVIYTTAMECVKSCAVMQHKLVSPDVIGHPRKECSVKVAPDTS